MICSSAISGLVLKTTSSGMPALRRRPAPSSWADKADRQARGLARERQAHSHLAVVLLAQLAAVLPRNADRMLALLGKAGVVHDPGLDRPAALQRRQDKVPHLGQNPIVRPWRVRHEVQQRLPGRNPIRSDSHCQRLYALAVERQQKAVAVALKQLDTIRVPDHLAQRRDIAFQTPLALNKILTHPYHQCKIDESELLTDLRSERFYFLQYNIFYDSVGLVPACDDLLIYDLQFLQGPISQKEAC